jgi:chemotaxis protein MotB
MAGNEAVIIKKVKKSHGHGHHGGAWKVAYADFVTAMMAFFLLLWLISTTTPEQKRGIAEYFAPASISQTTSGAGGILGGTEFSPDGARHGGASSLVEDMAPPQPPTRAAGSTASESTTTETETRDEAPPSQELSDSMLERALAVREAYMFEQAEMSLRQAMQDMPELSELSRHIIIDQTPEGMRIQLVDQEGRAMFAPGSAEPYERTRLLLVQVAEIINRLPNRVTISGHTDSAPFHGAGGYTNWEMSADRANAARRILQGAGVDMDRVYQVTGKAGSDPLFPDDPYMAANRRISIVLLREAPVLPPGHRL